MSVTKEVLEALRADDADHVEIFQEFLDDSGDPNCLDSLLGLCESAGMPDENTDPQYCVQSVRHVDDLLTFRCDVFFDEKFFGGGCPDMPTIIPRTGTVTYEIDLRTGALRGFVQSE